LPPPAPGRAGGGRSPSFAPRVGAHPRRRPGDPPRHRGGRSTHRLGGAPRSGPGRMTEPPEREAPPAPPAPPASGVPDVVASEVRTRIATLEREARALEPDPGSARLYHELGLLWERPLGNLRAAAAAFQAAYRIAPRFVENLRSARRI